MIVVLFPAGGGLGNLLFQHHAIFALAKRHGCPVYIDATYYESARIHMTRYGRLFQHVRFLQKPDLEVLCRDKRVYYYKEPRFPFDDPPTLGEHDVLVVNGYFQSFHYFASCLPELRTLLTENEAELYARMTAKHARIADGRPTTCVHIRRGDYLRLSHYHTVLSPNYYENALALPTIAGTRLVVFAEDIHEIRSWPVWRSKDVFFVEDEPDPLPTLFLMSMCDHFVVANSSLSLSAFYLSAHPDTSVLVAPKQWFGPSGPEFQIHDIVPSHATLLDA